MVLIIILAVIFYASYRLYQHFFPTPEINPNGKYVLITGCDTGFGHGLALELDQCGFNVLAGVFLADSVTSLQSKLSSKATVFRLDVTKSEDIDEAYRLVQSKTKALHALVNNAGIGTSGAVDLITLDSIRHVMEVNFFAQVAMTKKFLPLLIAKRDSRVVNLCSVAGYLASSNMTAYCASKYAFEAFSDCLRREMFPWGLRVSIIEPGFMKTAIIQQRPKPFEEFWSSLSADTQERWGEEYLKRRHGGAQNSALIRNAEDPIKVVRVLRHAVANSAPLIRYRPGWQSGLLFFPLSTLPAGFTDWFLRKLTKSTHLPASVAKQLQD